MIAFTPAVMQDKLDMVSMVTLWKCEVYINAECYFYTDYIQDVGW